MNLRLDFDRRLKLQFHRSKVTSDAGLLPFRELDEVLRLTEIAGDRLVDPRTGKNGQHRMTGLFRQSTFGRLGGYEDVNDADRLKHDPAMRWIVGGGAVTKQAASASQMGRFETEFLATDDNIADLADLLGRVRMRRTLTEFKLPIARCPAQPEQIRAMSASSFPQTACSAIIENELGIHRGNVGLMAGVCAGMTGPCAAVRLTPEAISMPGREVPSEDALDFPGKRAYFDP